MCKDRTKDNIGIHILSIFHYNKVKQNAPRSQTKDFWGHLKTNTSYPRLPYLGWQQKDCQLSACSAFLSFSISAPILL